MRDLVLIPLSGDQGSHRYRPIASFTQSMLHGEPSRADDVCLLATRLDA